MQKNNTLVQVYEAMGRMYADTKTWTPAPGCGFGCIYCVPSFQETIRNFEKLRGGKCQGCLTYTPHEHPERLRKIPSKTIVFVEGNGDVAFVRPVFMRRMIAVMIEHHERCPRKVFYIQSKSPGCLRQYLSDLEPIRDSVVLLTTLETNRDEGYESISKAPPPSERFAEFLALPWKRKIPTIEPVMKFDLECFVTWIKDIESEAVYLGYNSRPQRVSLPEPTPTEFQELHARLSEFTEVRLKDTRGIAYDEFERMRNSRVDYVTNLYPLVDEKITRKECEEIIADEGLTGFP